MPGAYLSVNAEQPFSSYTMNNGATWVTIDAGSTQYTSVKMLNKNVGYAGSFNFSATAGGIYKWKGGQIFSSSDISEAEKPATAILYQNYPNPFNPVTTIEFASNKQQKVKLVVYNAKGELVRTLVNSDLSAGYHNVSFDGSSLNSGLYFYQLQTKEKVISRKMLLVK
mgnify:CR=1 FL=1